ncbi:unnamed protein product, partial [Pylaiella littoralis]
ETLGIPVGCRKLSSGWDFSCPTSGEAPRIRTPLQPRVLAVPASRGCGVVGCLLQHRRRERVGNISRRRGAEKRRQLVSKLLFWWCL